MNAKEVMNKVTDRWLARDKGKLPYITRKEIEIIASGGYAISEYPRKKQVVINGHKYFRIK